NRRAVAGRVDQVALRSGSGDVEQRDAALFRDVHEPERRTAGRKQRDRDEDSEHRGECKLRRVRTVWLIALLSMCPSTAAAQKDAFRDALIGFHAKLAGEHGDEGPAIAAELDRMASALKAWDPRTTVTGPARASGAAARAEDPVRAYETKKVDVLFTMLDRRFQSVPPDRQLDLFPETALVPDRSAVTPVFAP